MMGYCYRIAIFLSLCTLVSSEIRPEVTLSHGGILRGLNSTWLGKDVEVYLGIRYAQAPVGDLRFKKPVEASSWAGTQEASAYGQLCPQPTNDLQGVLGAEDCLFLDITVPGGTKPTDKKAVMIFVHGGGYMMGSKSIYLGAPLAVHGDVIVVTINYRLGVLGFLGDELGGANFGLWDQRQAIIWVQKHIRAFGGDPDNITIFGESAGGGSVSAQTMSPHNDGIFKRAIMQSGSLYMMFDHSQNTRQKIITHYREKSGCSPTVSSVYDCLRGLTTTELLGMPLTDSSTFLGLLSDNDFFPKSVEKEVYDLDNRFDLMSGMNGQEGGLTYAMEVAFIASSLNKTNTDGMDMELVRAYVKVKCNQFTPKSVDLCANYIIRLYKLNDPNIDDKERARRITALSGEAFFNVDVVNQLEQHADSGKATYAYYFTECYKPQPPNPLWTIPDWLKTTADHGDDIAFLFGASALKTGKEKGELWRKIISGDEIFLKMMTGDPNNQAEIQQELEYETLANRMMTLWTNFAKSGNPNKPVTVDTPDWPLFTKEEGKFLELNLNNTQVIDTPHKERLHSFQRNIMTARRTQLEADVPVIVRECDKTATSNGL